MREADVVPPMRRSERIRRLMIVRASIESVLARCFHFPLAGNR